MNKRKRTKAQKVILASMALIIVGLVIILGLRIHNMSQPTPAPVSEITPPSATPAPTPEATPTPTATPEPTPEPTPTPEPEPLRVYYSCPFDEEQQDYIYDLLELFDIDLDLAYPLAMVYRESSFHQMTVSDHGAMGYIQLMPKTYKAMYAEVTGRYNLVLVDDVYNFKTNLACGLYYLRHVAERYGRCDGVVSQDTITELATRYAMGPSGGYKYYAAHGTWESSYSRNLKHAAVWLMEHGSLDNLDW